MFSPDHAVRRCREPTDRDPEGPRRAAGARPAGTADPAHRDSCADRTGETRALGTTDASSRPGGRMAAGVLASAVLAWLYARGGVAGARLRRPRAVAARARREPHARRLAARRVRSCRSPSRPRSSPGSAPRSAATRSSAPPPAWRCCSLVAPLFQPQFFVFALVRHVVGRRHGPRAARARRRRGVGRDRVARAQAARRHARLRAVSVASPAPGRRRRRRGGPHAAAAAGERSARGGARAPRAKASRAMARPLALAALVPLLLAAYGLAALAAAPTPAGKPLRMGLVQSNIVDYERLRREKGAAAVVREVLDTHYAMTLRRRRAAARRRGAVVGDRVPHDLRPSEERGRRRARPRDPRHRRRRRRAVRVRNLRPRRRGRIQRGRLRRARARACSASIARRAPFPLTEYVPAWLDGPTLRRWLPWTGTWRPGTGARVFPLRLADGREIPVLPLICLDDMDAGLAIDGARLGAQAILTMSNDRWFTDRPQGAATAPGGRGVPQHRNAPAAVSRHQQRLQRRDRRDRQRARRGRAWASARW